VRVIIRRDFDSYEAYVHAQGGKARSCRHELLAALPTHTRGFSAMFREAVPLLKPGPVLCLGARSGAEVLAFDSLGLSGSVGVDLHPVGKNVRAGDWHAMPEFADGSFANVYTNSFDHCLMLEKACAEIARILEPGGRFYLMASDKGVKDSARADAWATSDKHNEALYWSRAEDLRDAVMAFGFQQVRRSWKVHNWSHFVLERKK
jgi:SAM-dependent methyltransferase